MAAASSALPIVIPWLRTSVRVTPPTPGLDLQELGRARIHSGASGATGSPSRKCCLGACAASAGNEGAMS
eukprot:5529328-Alexandrium_andersonii.AAC.1